MGQLPRRANIINISNGYPCMITTSEANGFTTHKFVRLTDLNGCKPLTSTAAITHGSDPLNNKRYRIVVVEDDQFYLEDPITFKKIDSTVYPPYITGGYAMYIEEDFFYHPEEEE